MLAPSKEDPIGIAEVILIGIALSADAMSVTIATMIANPRLSRGWALSMPVAFGLFQGLMPVAGYFAGTLAQHFVEAYAGIIALGILGVIGSKMIWDGLHDDEGEGMVKGSTSIGVPTLLLQAVATSIDALAVGVTFAATNEPVFVDAGIIGACTFALCLAMLAIGRRFGAALGARAQVVGGLILIAIGIKAMFF